MLPLLAALAVQALTAQDGAFLRCAGIADDAERLACFDRAAAMVETRGESAAAPVLGPALPPETAPPPAPATAPAAALPPPAADPEPERRRFGLPQRRAEPDSQTLGVAELSLDRAGKLVVTLADGQVWRQIGGDTTAVRLPRAGTEQTATVRRAALGSYRMRIEPLGRTVRVKRVE